MELINFNNEENLPNSLRLTNSSHQGRSYSMPHFTTTDDNDDIVQDISSVMGPRRSADMDRLYNAYRGGEIQGTRLLDVPDWYHEEEMHHQWENNNESWCKHIKKESSKGFRLDRDTGRVKLKGISCSSNTKQHIDKVTGLTTRVRTTSIRDKSAFHTEKKDKKIKKNVWSSFFSCGC